MEMVKIIDFMSEDLICLDLKSKNKEETLKELVEIIAKSENITDKEKCYAALVARENLGSTGIGKGVAIPHAKTEFSNKLTIGFGINREGVNFESLDDKQASIFFVFASPIKDSHTYLKILARISRLIRNEEFRNRLINAKTPAEIISFIDKEEEI